MLPPIGGTWNRTWEVNWRVKQDSGEGGCCEEAARDWGGRGRQSTSGHNCQERGPRPPWEKGASAVGTGGLQPNVGTPTEDYSAGSAEMNARGECREGRG